MDGIELSKIDWKAMPFNKAVDLFMELTGCGRGRAVEEIMFHQGLTEGDEIPESGQTEK